MFSTVDICAVDLYTGICNFLKAGAVFHIYQKRSLGGIHCFGKSCSGLVQQLDFDTASRKLYHGDYLIMMTDGVWMHCLQNEEETMKEIIMDVHEKEPRKRSGGEYWKGFWDTVIIMHGMI